MRIKILDLPADTVAQSVEHRRDKPMTSVQILMSVRFFLFVPLRSFFSATPAKLWKVRFRQGFA